MDAVSVISLTLGAAWASGINLYAAILVLGILGSTGDIVLPEGLQILQSPPVLIVAGVMFCVEFFADKIPGLDSAWDAVHSFIRIPAGAILAAQAIGDVSPALILTAGLLGGTISAASHTTKAGTRLLINASPEPVTNWTASITEDLLVIAGLWAALHHPWIFLILLVVFLLFCIWFIPKVWRGILKLLKLLKEKISPSKDLQS